MKISLQMILVRWIVLTFLFAILIFLPAGTLNWPEGWLLLGMYTAGSLVIGSWMMKNDPDWLAERFAFKTSGMGWDQALLSLIGISFISIFIISGISHADGYISGWGFEALGFLGLVLAFAFVFPVLKVNPYITRMVKVSKGQKVISTGPYSVVRHPMYAGAIVFYLSIPLALGSFYALIPALCGAALFVLRTYMEDRTLRKGLKGYEEYCDRTRYRLVPYIW